MNEITDNEQISWWKRPFRLEKVDPDTLERQSLFSMQRWAMVVVAGGLFFLMFGLFYLLIGYTPFRRILPGDYSQLEVVEIIDLRDKMKEMEEVLRQQDKYILNMQGLLSGKPIEQLQKSATNSESSTIESSKMVSSGEDAERVRENLEMENRLEALRQSINQNGVSLDRKEQLPELMSPILGPVGKGYDPELSHYGIDILAPKNTAIKAIADGIVIQADWTVETGNTIMILHSGGLISVYKHNSSLLKGNYEKVTRGEAIAIIGNTGTLTTGPHVHFEIWVNGFPENPSDYINFQ